MPKKKWTEEEKKQFGEKMKAAREAKKTLSEVPQEVPVEEIKQEEESDLVKRVKELEKLLANLPPAASNPVVTARGIIGTLDKFTIDPSYYPDPTERLSSEARLKPWAFDENYELEWNVKSTSYETIDGRRLREPRFEINLIRKVRDTDTNELTNQRYYYRRGVFHEDPQAAIEVANHYGLPIDESNEKQFLDEMRYLRMKEWLFDAFFPPKSTRSQENEHETVIGNRLVQVFEVSSIEPQDVKAKLSGN